MSFWLERSTSGLEVPSTLTLSTAPESAPSRPAGTVPAAPPPVPCSVSGASGVHPSVACEGSMPCSRLLPPVASGAASSSGSGRKSSAGYGVVSTLSPS
ncbi:hypothetical protein [Microbacterium sp. Root53]|uniref:hypothetical protein n=1 Tax=Microbacterium sp. Root53 TaxID=1736553 RepID=UPI0012E3992E|nr:hypothetical protein [Microbacterium sp. Root53]